MESVPQLENKDIHILRHSSRLY